MTVDVAYCGICGRVVPAKEVRRIETSYLKGAIRFSVQCCEACYEDAMAKQYKEPKEDDDK